MAIDKDLIDRLLDGVRLTQAEGRPAIGFDSAAADLIEAHPELLSMECDAELDRRQQAAASDEARQHVAAARRVLAVCRPRGDSSLLREGAEDDPAEPEDPLPLETIGGFLSVASVLEQHLSADGVLRASLVVARALALLQLQDEPRADRAAVREAALGALDEGLAVLWRLAPDGELAELQGQLGILWAERLGGDRGTNQERAIACYEAALTVFSREAMPHNWARVQNNLGNNYHERLGGDRGANQERAIACYEGALTVFSREATPDVWASVQNNLAATYNERLGGDRQANQERTISCYEAALTVFSREATPYKWAGTLNDLGIAYRKRLAGDRGANQERAIACCEAALTVFSHEATPDVWATVQNNLGDVYGQRLVGDRGENQERAIACYEAALTVRTRDAAPHEWAKTQNSLGGVYTERLVGDRGANQERAIACFEAALAVFSRDASPNEWASLQGNLGGAYTERLVGDRGANQERAIACFEAALAVFSRDASPNEWASTQNNLGNVYGQRLVGDRSENQERAIACYEAALTVQTRDATPQNWANTQNNLGEVYRERLAGDRSANQDRAIACYERALTVRKRETMPHDWAMTQNNLGIVYAQDRGDDWVGNQERAIACFEAALTVYSRDATPYKWASTLNDLGNAYRQRLVGDRSENQERAVACFEAALTVFSHAATPHRWAGTQHNLGAAYAQRLGGDQGGNLERAIACFEAALPLLRLSGPPLALDMLIALGGLHSERRRPAAARAAWQEAQALRERLLRAGASVASRGEAARSSQGLAVRLALLEVALGAPGAAVATLERGRALALRSALALDDVWLAGLAPDLRAPVVHARDGLEALRRAPPAATGGTAGDVAALREWEEQVTAAEAALDASLATAQQAHGFAPPQPLEAAALAALAPERGALVLLAGGPDGGLAFVLPHGCGGPGPGHAVPLPEATADALRGTLTRCVNEVYGAIPAGATLADLVQALQAPNAALEEALQALWRTVMAPVLAKTAELGVPAGGDLVLVPQGDLALLPLHAAGRMQADGTLWTVLDEHVVSYAPSGEALRTARRRLEALPPGQDSLRGGLFGAFNPMRGTKDALPLAEEADMPALLGLFGASARILAGPEATVANVLAALRETPSAFVHLACHGRFDMADPARSGLQLANGAMLTVEAIVAQMRLAGNRWVALSACESAMTDVLQQPDEAVGLPAALLRAGAPGVMATLWSVYDRPTSLLVPRLYGQYLRQDEARPGRRRPTPAAALRDTVLWLRAGADDTAATGLLQAAKSGATDTPPHAAGPGGPAVALRHLLRMPVIWAAYSYHGT